MSKYEPRYGRNYMKPIYAGGIAVIPETPFEDTIRENGTFGPVKGHYSSVKITTAVKYIFKSVLINDTPDVSVNISDFQVSNGS